MDQLVEPVRSRAAPARRCPAPDSPDAGAGTGRRTGDNVMNKCGNRPTVTACSSSIRPRELDARRAGEDGTSSSSASPLLVGCSTAMTSGERRRRRGALGRGHHHRRADRPRPPTTTSTTTDHDHDRPTTTTTTTTTTCRQRSSRSPVVDPPLGAVGTSNGDETARVQQRLLELGFWVHGRRRRYGLTTRQAVMAFEKFMGFDADGRSTTTAAAHVAMDLRPHARANSGTLVEIDKGKQLLFFVIDGRTEWILNTSTGNGESYTEPDQNTPGETISGVSLTPSGLHDVNRQRPEGWWEGDLGRSTGRSTSSAASPCTVEQHPELPGLARLRAGQRAGDGLDLGRRHHAARYPRLGPRRRLSTVGAAIAASAGGCRCPEATRPRLPCAHHTTGAQARTSSLLTLVRGACVSWGGSFSGLLSVAFSVRIWWWSGRIRGASFDW